MIKKITAVAFSIAFLCSNAYAFSGASSWAEKKLSSAAELNIVPESLLNVNVSDMIKKGECASLCVKFYETASGKTAEAAANPFDDNVSADVLKAASAGIVGAFSGRQFNENTYASREEIADMMARTYAAVSGTGATLQNKVIFSDDSLISDWARESVYFIQDKGIIHIVGSNKFAPKNSSEEETRANYANMSVQTALISSVRMYEQLKGNIENIAEENKKTSGEDCLSMIPKIEFGTAENAVINSDSASITVNNSSQQDFYDYVEKTKTVFPEEIYVLEGQNYKAWDGEYTVNIVYGNGVLTVEVFVN